MLQENLRATLALGDPEQVAALIDAGADIHYRDENGYDALLDAVHGRDVLHDDRLIELLTLLIEHGVSLTGTSTHGESAVRVLSCIARFDAVQLLLQAGANREDLQLTKLIASIMFGSLADVEEAVANGEDMEGREWCDRTAWLVAIQSGDIPKAQFLLEHGAHPNAKGWAGRPALFYAIENSHPAMLRWLLDIGADIYQTTKFGGTALATAAENDNVEVLEILLQAGADVNQKSGYESALSIAQTPSIIGRLLDAGADPQELSFEGRRAILGYSPDPDPDQLRVSAEEFRKFRARRFGRHNPEKMNNPFWEGMIRSGLNAYLAIVQIKGERSYGTYQQPVWCAQRFGQSLTFVPDGRIIQVAGEHEDSYDADFCIYNDVFVHKPDGTITILGYPKSVFPPTDFHTATLIDGFLYLIGLLGYGGTRRYGETPVYRLDVTTFQIERFTTTGDNPGWIYKHRADQVGVHEIQISGGQILTGTGGSENQSINTDTFVLDIEKRVWSRQDPETA